MSRGLFALAVGALVLLQGAMAQAGPTNAEKCEADKLKRAGKHAFCQMKAQSKFVKKGDAFKLSSDLEKCDTKIEAAFAKADGKYPADCPTLGDVGDIEAQVSGDTADLGVLLSGGTLPGCGDGSIGGGELCDGVDLGGATCASVITDTTGTLACTPACYAGHNDWRLPSSAGCCGFPSGEVAELESIVDCSFGNPCIDPIFGPTASSNYWSSTSFANNPDFAWFVDLLDGHVSYGFKNSNIHVRAVRGGS